MFQQRLGRGHSVIMLGIPKTVPRGGNAVVEIKEIFAIGNVFSLSQFRKALDLVN